MTCHLYNIHGKNASFPEPFKDVSNIIYTFWPGQILIFK